MAFTLITKQFFKSTGNGLKLNIPSGADYVEVFNITKTAATNPNAVILSRWFGPSFGPNASARDSGLQTVKTTFDLTSAYASGGFTYVTTFPYVEAQAANPITEISKAAQAAVTQTNTYSENDLVVLYNTTGMLQISGMTFQISTVSGSGYTLKGLDSSAFTTEGTAGFTRRISSQAVEPEYLYITKITQATQAVITTSIDPTQYYVAGMKIYLSVPPSFGMTQINGLTGTIVSLNATNYSMTIDIDTSGFSAFAFPASTSSPKAQLFATLSPAGASTQKDPVTLVQTGYDFTFQPFRTGQFVPYLYLAGGANSPGGALNDLINVLIYKCEN